MRLPTPISLPSRPAATTAASMVPPASAPLLTATVVPPLPPTPSLATPPLHLVDRERKSCEALMLNEEADPHHALDSSTRTSSTSTSSSGSNTGSSSGATGLALSSFGVAGVIGVVAALF